MTRRLRLRYWKPRAAASSLPGAYGGRAALVVANALAAIAAVRGAGVSAPDIRCGLAAFSPDADNPGRGTVFRAGSSPVIVDYRDNAAALRATGRFIRETWSERFAGLDVVTELKQAPPDYTQDGDDRNRGS
ncbi:MAG TPA: hypothetical protein VMA73_01710 [Streptosporangiaceae bacterium]|nr:hypothetical protein [Streptosporangiaceae bacterium]